MNWFNENKDEIKDLLGWLLITVEIILGVSSWIFIFFGVYALAKVFLNANPEYTPSITTIATGLFLNFIMKWIYDLWSIKNNDKISKE